MTEQIRNAELIELIRPDFFARDEPNASWSHAISNHLSLPDLHCFWPMSAHLHTHVTEYISDIASGFNLTMTNDPLSQLFPTTLVPCVQFDSANSRYLSYADDPQFDIYGTETHVLAAQRGLTMGGWFRWHTLANAQGMMSKWITAGNQRAYRIYKTAGHNIVFEVSSLGTAASVVTVTSTGTVAANTWYHIVGRFVPSVALDVYIDAVRTTNAVGTPASIFHANSTFSIGRTDGGSYMDGFTSLCFLCASICADSTAAANRDLIPWALYEHSKRMFNK
jgi:hypothetical protein